jgi:hypothetical protein
MEEPRQTPFVAPRNLVKRRPLFNSRQPVTDTEKLEELDNLEHYLKHHVVQAKPPKKTPARSTLAK